MKIKYFVGGMLALLLLVCVFGCLFFDKDQGLSSGILLFTAVVVCWYSWETRQLREISSKTLTEATRPFLVLSLKYCSNKCCYNFLLKNVGASLAHSITILDNTIRCRNGAYGFEIDGMLIIEKTTIEKAGVAWDNFQTIIIDNKWGRNIDGNRLALKANWKNNETEMKEKFGDGFTKLQTVFKHSLNVTHIPQFHLPAVLSLKEEVILESVIIGEDKNEWLIKPMKDKKPGTITFAFQNVNNDSFFTKIEIFCVSEINGLAVYSSRVTDFGPSIDTEIKLRA
ncbi:MAG: hypothetical protein KAJ18_01875 [Candidatus Omnitrophica bacterium]|nr:hypothetical protein [Candidatus Omnitrophota bacterium]